MAESTGEYRPRSTWKVLGGLILAIATGLLLAGLCVAAFVSSTPDQTLEAARTELQIGLPRFYPLPSFGADSTGRTFGVWVVLHDDGTADALYSRDPRTACYLPWRPELAVEGRTGVFRDPCHGSTYDLAGTVVFGPALRDMDEFDAEVSETTVAVDLERIRLGDCRSGVPEAERVPCSEPGMPRYEKEQPTFPTGGGG